MSDLIDWIEEELTRKGWNRNDLSIRSGVDSGYLSRILNRERGYGPDTVLSIAQALDLPPELAFRKAGWLPESDSPHQVADEIIDYKQAELTLEQKEELINFIEFMQDRDDKRTRRRTIEQYTREGTTPPETLKTNDRT